MYQLFKNILSVAEATGEVFGADLGEYFLPNSEHAKVRGVDKNGREFWIEAVVRGVQDDADRD